MIHFNPIEHHIRDRAQSRLYDGRPKSDSDLSSEDWSALRDARRDATLCPDCQDEYIAEMCSPNSTATAGCPPRIYAPCQCLPDSMPLGTARTAAGAPMMTARLGASSVSPNPPKHVVTVL